MKESNASERLELRWVPVVDVRGRERLEARWAPAAVVAAPRHAA